MIRCGLSPVEGTVRAIAASASSSSNSPSATISPFWWITVV